MSDDLQVLAPEGASVMYRGERLVITPIPVGVIPLMVSHARPVIDAVFALDDVPDVDDEGALFDLALNLIENHSEAVFEAAALCVERDATWIKRGNIAEFTELAVAIFKVNHDFFVQRLGPLLARAMATGMGRGASGAGPTPSSS
jgi:hypothetical protein